MKFRILNDLHLGVQRSGGTTPASAAALREYAMDQFRQLINGGAYDHAVINGDMFDTYNVPMDAYVVTSEWLATTFRRLTLVPGNHDLSKNSANLGSFQFLAMLLQARFPDRVQYLQGGNWIDEDSGLYTISHVPNQELFELALSRVPDNVKVLLLHCNYDNTFACAADHSLNLDRATAKVLTKRRTIVLAHEHQGRTLMGDKVIIVGNHFPTSISDCMPHGDGQKDGRKYLLEIDGDDMELVDTWSVNSSDGTYLEVNWGNISSGMEHGKFMRITGEATAAQAAEVIKVISKLRQNSDAFVITNAVKVEGSESAGEMADSAEDIRSVDVIEMLLEALDPDQQVAIRKLLAEAA
jgi:DNA repair exonuclease SbcCD nuclease subunit